MPVYVVCRRGNDSQIAVQLLKDYFEKQSSAGKDASSIVVKDIVGGLSLWTDEVDSQFPKYWLLYCICLILANETGGAD